MPAQAGIQFARHQSFWIPAFAGMTSFTARKSPTAHLFCMYNCVAVLVFLARKFWGNNLVLMISKNFFGVK